MTDDITEEATIHDMGALDVFVYEDDEGNHWVRTNPRFVDGTVYESRAHLWRDIQGAIDEHERNK